MEYFWALLILLCLIAAVIGFVMLFIRGRRSRGALLLFGGFFASIFAALFTSFSIDLDEGASGARSITDASDETTQESTVEELDDAKSVASAPDGLEGFPDAKTKEHASALGISRYEAFQLLGDESAIRNYCDFAATTDKIIVEKYDAIDAGGNEEELTKVAHEAQALEHQQANTSLGLEGDELGILSIAGHWDLYCRAYEKGWAIMTVDQAIDLDKQIARRARDAVELIYIDRLKNGSASTYFTTGNFNAVDCDLKRDLIDDFSFVGCQLVGLGNETPWHIYLIGANDGEILLHPINGKTAQSVEIFWTEVPANRKANVELAGYVSGLLPLSEIVAEFE